jgi:hypothetical protein
MCRQVVQHDVHVEFAWDVHVDPPKEREHTSLQACRRRVSRSASPVGMLIAANRSTVLRRL